MYRPRVIPTLLLKGQGLVKTVNFNKETYIGDPINAVKIFNDLEVDELIFLDITATNENRTLDIQFASYVDIQGFQLDVTGGIFDGASNDVLDVFYFSNISAF